MAHGKLSNLPGASVQKEVQRSHLTDEKVFFSSFHFIGRSGLRQFPWKSYRKNKFTLCKMK